ncbi:HutD family protein [Myxococcota bacterium]|nr:HutD family protein [Myxococcota bacterium]
MPSQPLIDASIDALLGPPRHVLPTAWQTMPWRNGGGRTHELLKLGESALGFTLRVSIAEVQADGPFSRFDGVNRALLLLSGAGMTLTWSNGEQTTLTPEAPLVAFPGEEAPENVLLSGPTTDLNVMTDRAALSAQVILCPPGPITAPLTLLLRPAVVGGEALPALTLLVRAAPALCDAPTAAILLSSCV